LPLVYAELRVGVGGGIFCLGDRSDYNGDEGGVAHYRGIEEGGVRVTEEVEAAGNTAGLGAG